MVKVKAEEEAVTNGHFTVLCDNETLMPASDSQITQITSSIRVRIFTLTIGFS